MRIYAHIFPYQEPLLHSPEPEEAPEPVRLLPQASVALPPMHSGRVRRAPRTFQDFVPNVRTTDTLHESLARLAPVPEDPEPPPDALPDFQEDPEPPSHPDSRPSPWYETEPDEFGIFKRFPRKPQHVPSVDSGPDDFVDNPNIAPLRTASDAYSDPARSFMTSLGQVGTQLKDWFWPFRNPTAARVSIWRNTGSSKKSLKEMSRFWTDVASKPNFETEHLATAQAEEKCAKSFVLSEKALAKNGWTKSSVEIPAPKERHRYKSEADVPKITIQNVWTRKIIPIIRSACEGELAHDLNFVPHEAWQIHGDGRMEQIVTEVYNSPQFLKEDAKIQALP